MDREWRDEWIRALRSGEFEQGYDRLRVGASTFCCLGVLCQIRPDVAWVLRDQPGTADHDDIAGSPLSLPWTLAHELCLSHHTERVLASMNDRGRSFTEIADYIEQNL